MTTETQCDCRETGGEFSGAGHFADCSAKPDALTRLEKTVGLLALQRDGCDRADLRAAAENLISEAREEMKGLRELLRLTNDKMAEQVRQALWGMADEALDDCDTLEHFIIRMRAVKDANAPKD